MAVRSRLSIHFILWKDDIPVITTLHCDSNKYICKAMKQKLYIKVNNSQDGNDVNMNRFKIDLREHSPP